MSYHAFDTDISETIYDDQGNEYDLIVTFDVQIGFGSRDEPSWDEVELLSIHLDGVLISYVALCNKFGDDKITKLFEILEERAVLEYETA